jgi:hypothetical protein
MRESHAHTYSTLKMRHSTMSCIWSSTLIVCFLQAGKSSLNNTATWTLTRKNRSALEQKRRRLPRLLRVPTNTEGRMPFSVKYSRSSYFQIKSCIIQTSYQPQNQLPERTRQWAYNFSLRVKSGRLCVSVNNVDDLRARPANSPDFFILHAADLHLITYAR